jgi:ABC-2 type transport system permease protein
MNKYLHVVNIGIQNTLVYRVNFLFRAFIGLVPLFATISVWKVIYSSKEADSSVAGYTLGGMISYYLLVTIVDALTAVNEDDWQIAADIKEGTINQFLLKPVDYLWYRLSLFVGGRLIYTLVAIAPILLFVLLQREYLVLPPNFLAFAVFGAALVLTGLLQFFMSYTMALLSFWVVEVSTFIFIVFAFEQIAGGHLFPIDIMPPAVVKLLSLTPFPYLLFFPVSVYLGRIQGNELWTGLAIQAFWVAAAYVAARLVFRGGIKKYTAVGG